ncbi:uncharacterized protein LOC124435191 [Xenia sp. Carnegie-2017]|uniref:uncharacterized protein LOC124435191 n=1 Tax=Xenia sp. Carnegie-2017 TaxID=2897299 RepID=UPI001F0371EC|nr:uncharacterized protein LOC124435191 [Xenia sp. Carnegie-2017]
MNHISSENQGSPKVSTVHFEHIGEDVAVKVSGNDMWFVYELSIYCEQFCCENMLVDVIKSSGSDVQTRIKEKNVHYEEEVRVQVKTHFENSKYLPSFDHVAAKTTTYSVTQRQQQLAKHRPSEIIELAFLSALLEKRITTHSSIKMKSIKDFFTDAVSVVPIESLFYAIGESSSDVILDCCEILSTSEINSETLTNSEISVKVLENALFRIRRCQSLLPEENLTDEMSSLENYRILMHESLEVSARRHHLIGLKEFVLSSRKDFKERSVSQLSLEKIGPMLKKSTSHIMHLLEDRKPKRRNRRRKSAPIYKTDLNVIYPNVDAVDGTKKNDRSCKAPMTLLNDGKNKLLQLCEELTAEPQQCATSEISSCSLNNRMLEVLNGLLNEFETCSTLLGTFMQSQVQIPLEHAGNDKYVNEIARYANSFGLSVWGLLIVPFNYLEQMIRSSGEFGQLVIELSRRLNDFREYMFPTDERELFDYDEKLHFLLGSMKKSIAWNKNYVSYPLERQLEHQCSKRNIYYHTPIEIILQQWNTKFEG